jgi:hypothetical protein
VDWNRILQLVEESDEPVELEPSDFDGDTLEQLPEHDASLLVHGDPTLWISRDGATVYVQIEWMQRAQVHPPLVCRDDAAGDPTMRQRGPRLPRR